MKAYIYLFGDPNNLGINRDKDGLSKAESDQIKTVFTENLFLEKWIPEKKSGKTEFSFWKDCLGTITGEMVTESSEVLSFVYLQSEKEAALGEDFFVNKLHIAFLSLRLAYPLRPHHDLRALILIGDYTGSSSDYQLERVSSVHQLAAFVDPFYARILSTEQSKWYYQSFYYEDILPKAIEFYKAFDGHSRDMNHSSPLCKAVYCFSKAIDDVEEDFALPNFIRGIECLLQLPPGRGYAEFAKRISSFYNSDNFNNPLYENLDFKLALETLYYMRNDCMHGREPNIGFKDKHSREMSDSDLAQYMFIAEDVLRRLIESFLFDERCKDYSSSRDCIETFWKQWGEQTKQPKDQS